MDKFLRIKREFKLYAQETGNNSFEEYENSFLGGRERGFSIKIFDGNLRGVFLVKQTQSFTIGKNFITKFLFKGEVKDIFFPCEIKVTRASFLVRLLSRRKAFGSYLFQCSCNNCLASLKKGVEFLNSIQSWPIEKIKLIGGVGSIGTNPVFMIKGNAETIKSVNVLKDCLFIIRELIHLRWTNETCTGGY